MTDRFVWDGGDDTTGTSWATAHTSIDAACDACTAGDVVYVDSTHDYSGYSANVVWSFPISATPTRIISVDSNTQNASDVIAYAPGAIDGPTGAGTHDITLSGNFEMYGVTIRGRDAMTFSNSVTQKTFLYDCTLDPSALGDVTTSSGKGGYTHFKNCTFDANSSAWSMNTTATSYHVYENCALAGTAINDFIFSIGGETNIVYIDGFDFSNGATNFQIFESGGGNQTDARIYGVTLPSGGSVYTNAISYWGTRVEAHNIAITGATGDVPTIECHYFGGDVTSDATTYLNGTHDGSDGYSIQMDCNTNTIAGSMTCCLRYKLWEGYITSANPTLTVQAISSTSGLTDDEFWIEVQHPDIASNDAVLQKMDFPDSTDGGDTTMHEEVFSAIGTPTAVTSGTGTWTSAPSTPTQYGPTKAITGAAGVYTVYVCLATGAATTVFVDPAVAVT